MCAVCQSQTATHILSQSKRIVVDALSIHAEEMGTMARHVVDAEGAHCVRIRPGFDPCLLIPPNYSQFTSIGHVSVGTILGWYDPSRDPSRHVGWHMAFSRAILEAHLCGALRPTV